MTSLASLRVGSGSLGWQEFGDVAVLGAMTRAMPGGDGSLEFTLPGWAAGQRRNVLVSGAEVVLDTGDDQWGGLIVGDPMAGYYAAQPIVSVAAAGLWSHAANRRDVAWVWCDSDPTQWFRIRQKYDAGDPDGLVEFVDQGKFSVDTEGRLFIRADADRTFAGYSRSTLAYWLNRGLVDCGCRIYAVDLVYKSNVPTDWTMRGRTYVGNPWECAQSGTLEIDDGTSRSSWRTLNTDLASPATSVIMNLYFNDSGSASPATDPYIKVREVVLRCRMDGASVDRSVTIDKAMGDLATLDGLASVTRLSTIGSARDHLALRPDGERSVADGLRELASLHSEPVEQFFDRAAGAWRYTAEQVPAAVDPTRNRHWVLDDGRAGEDSSGIVRDPEAAPEYLRVTFLSSGVTGLPNGFPRSYCHPTEPPDFTSNVAVNTDNAGVKMTDAQAADVAHRLFDQMNAASFSGAASLPETAVTISGQELPSRLMRPGDRVSILGREGATNLYVSETSYDWSSGQMSVSVGWPFDVKAARRVLPARHLLGPNGLGLGGRHGRRYSRTWSR